MHLSFLLSLSVCISFSDLWLEQYGLDTRARYLDRPCIQGKSKLQNEEERKEEKRKALHCIRNQSELIILISLALHVAAAAQLQCNANGVPKPKGYSVTFAFISLHLSLWFFSLNSAAAALLPAIFYQSGECGGMHCTVLASVFLCVHPLQAGWTPLTTCHFALLFFVWSSSLLSTTTTLHAMQTSFFCQN